MKILVTFLLISTALFSYGQSDERFIEVIGTGEINVEPDQAILAIELREFNRNGTTVSIEAAEADLRKILTSLNIPAEKLTANASPARPSPMARPGLAVGKEKELSLQLTDLKNLDALLGRLREAGIHASVTETAHTDVAKFINEARVKSIANAREKAGLLATAANAKLGRVLQIREMDTGPAYPLKRPVQRADRRVQSESADLEPIHVTYNVVVRFMIE